MSEVEGIVLCGYCSVSLLYLFDVQLKRRLRLDGKFLEQQVDMATENTPLTHHLSARYEKVE